MRTAISVFVDGRDWLLDNTDTALHRADQPLKLELVPICRDPQKFRDQNGRNAAQPGLCILRRLREHKAGYRLRKAIAQATAPGNTVAEAPGAEAQAIGVLDERGRDAYDVTGAMLAVTIRGYHSD